MSPTDRPTIGIAYFEDSGNPVKLRLFERLRRWADLRLFDPWERHPEIPELGLDLYHMARWSWPAFSDFQLAAVAGVPTINSYRGTVLTEDRVRSARVCLEHGIPFNRFEYGRADEITLEPPVIVKPRHELHDGGHEFQVVFAGDLSFDGERMVEQYITPSRAYKVFKVGDHVRVTERRTLEGSFEEVPASKRFGELAETVATLFDISLFELDVQVHKSYYVIDVNAVVSLEGVRDGVDIYEDLLRAASGRPVRTADQGR
jgi:glutathione synthase/RimK-type ligase-like ATP-grasp enzyme